MKRKSFLFLAWFIMVSSIVHAMDTKQFDSLISNIQEKKFEPVESFLSTKEAMLTKDPEYYVVLLNYVLTKGNQTGVVVAKGEPQKGDFSLKNPKTGETVGFLGERGGYDEKLIFEGISKTKKALPFFKSRLDIHFGIVSAADKIKRWDLIGNQLVDILKDSKEVDNKWTWGTVNSMPGEPKKFMLDNVQAYIANLFRMGNPTADDALIRASETMIKCYPDVIYGYSNLGVLYLAKKEYDKADGYLRKALAINPNDEIVKGNIEFLNKNRKK